MKQSNYFMIFGFEDIYLEDSFVLRIDETPNVLTFFLEFVLNEKHPLFSPPKQDEVYCYQNGYIVFSNLKKSIWRERNMKVFKDAEGKTDLGNIDLMFYKDGNTYLYGDWGEVEIWSDTPKLFFDK